jgi:hypothetical protein
MRQNAARRALEDPAWAWAAFEPSATAPWDLARVAQLHRRVGFAASWDVLARDLRAGPAASINRLLKGEATGLDGSPAAKFDAMLDSMAATLSGSSDLPQIQAIWLYRMIFTPHPLRERMTLFWHNHFATSFVKVQSAALMQRQNNLLRAHALGDFRALLGAIGKDPSMLIWLDSTINRRAKPNENYAREVMELFTLGRGNYTEKDVREAARAFTGWFVIQDDFQVVARQHDDGTKQVLGHSGRWSGDDIPGILLEQRACAEFLCRKLFRHFISDTLQPADCLITPLARAFRDANYRIEVPLGMIVRSNLFFDPSVRRRRVKSPVEFAVGTIRALEVLNPTVQARALADACTRMGQSLYAPPSVAGWDGGPAWINSTAMLARANLVLGLLSDQNEAFGQRLDPWKLAAKYKLASRDAAWDGLAVRPTFSGPAGAAGRHRDRATGFLLDLLVQDALEPKAREPIISAASAKAKTDTEAIRDATRLILTAPEYQLA